MFRHLRHPRILAGILFVAALLAIALWPRAIPVDVAPAERGPLQVTIDEEGETRVRDRFVISAPVAGRVLRIELDPGDTVRRGETVLATLLSADSTPLDARSRGEARAGVSAAESAIEMARADHQRAAAAAALARSERDRALELARDALVAPQLRELRELEATAAEQAERAARAGIARAEHGLAMSRARLIQGGGSGRPITIVAPVDGVVLRRMQESEGVVPAGTVLFEIGNPRELEVVSDLLSTDAVKVSSGNPVVIEQWGGDTPLRGRVRRVEPAGFMKVSALGVEEQRVNVVVDLEGEAPAIGDGYRVEVRVVVWEKPDVLRVPASSLFRRGADWAVFAVEDGRARLRVLKVGRQNGIAAEVLDGLGAGARVVVHPSDAVAEGTRVAPRG